MLRKEDILKYERFRLGKLEILKLAVNEWADVEVYKAKKKKFESTALRRNIKWIRRECATSSKSEMKSHKIIWSGSKQ